MTTTLEELRKVRDEQGNRVWKQAKYNGEVLEGYWCASKLYKGEFLFNSETNRFSKGHVPKSGQRVVSIGMPVKGRHVSRLVYETHVGPIPKGMLVIHDDGDRLNNDVSNLRLAAKGKFATKRKLNSGATAPIIATQVTTKEQRVFPSIAAAARALRIHRGNAGKVLRGDHRHTSGWALAYKTITPLFDENGAEEKWLPLSGSANLFVSTLDGDRLSRLVGSDKSTRVEAVIHPGPGGYKNPAREHLQRTVLKSHGIDVPSDRHVDHIVSEGKSNTLDNLQVLTPKQHMRKDLGKPLKIDDVLYGSRTEAAEKTGIPTWAIDRRLERGTLGYEHATEEEAQALKRRRIESKDDEVDSELPQGRYHWKKIPIKINGKCYETLKDAAEAVNLDTRTIKSRLKRGWPNYEAVTDEEVRQLKRQRISDDD